MSLSEKEVDLIGDILHADYNDYNTSRDDMTFYTQVKQKCDTLIEHTRNLREAITAWKSAENLTEDEVEDFLLHRDEDESQDEDEKYWEEAHIQGLTESQDEDELETYWVRSVV